MLRIALFVSLVSSLSFSPDAIAKAERTAPQAYERVWPVAIRHLRVDEGHKIVDKDSDAGYVVFEVSEGGKTFRGALELIRVETKGKRAKVRLVARIDDRPTYMEAGLLDRLLQKLRVESREQPEPEPVK